MFSKGTKYQALKQAFGKVISPDCRGIIDPQQRLQIIRCEIEKISDWILVVGSSMGGLIALLLQQSVPGQMAGLLLCAPALHRTAARSLNAAQLPPTMIIHGRQYAVIPIEGSRVLGAPLIEVDDDHRLKNRIPLIVNETAKLKGKLERV